MDIEAPKVCYFNLNSLMAFKSIEKILTHREGPNKETEFLVKYKVSLKLWELNMSGYVLSTPGVDPCLKIGGR